MSSWSPAGNGEEFAKLALVGVSRRISTTPLAEPPSSNKFLRAGHAAAIRIERYLAMMASVTSFRVLKERHKAKIHVQLLVAVEQGWTRIIGEEIDLHLAAGRNNDDILHYPGARFAGEVRQFK